MKNLIEEIHSSKPSDGEVFFWWIGQHGFVIKTISSLICIDPFLSDHPERLISSPLRPEDFKEFNLIACTHDHIDHLDRKSLSVIFSLNREAILVVPNTTKKNKIDVEEKRIVFLDDGQHRRIKNLKITAIKALHEFFDKDPELGYPYLSYIIEVDKVTILHMGDACIWEGLISSLNRWKFDLIFLPINGRDAVRWKANCMGNMTYQEAVDLAGCLKAKLTIPAHYGMFKFNTVDPLLFKDYLNAKYPDLECRICEVGKKEILKIK